MESVLSFMLLLREGITIVGSDFPCSSSLVVLESKGRGLEAHYEGIIKIYE